MESMILDNTSIQKQYQQYLIKLSSDLDIINILIEKDNTIYESNFNLEYLHQHKLLISSLTTQEIIEFIIELIDMNKIEIKEENMNLKLILISTLQDLPNVELNLQKKNITSNEMIEKLLKELENLKKENKELKESISTLNKRIETIEDKVIEKDDNKNKIKPVFSLKSMNLNFSTPNNNTSAISNISD